MSEKERKDLANWMFERDSWDAAEDYVAKKLNMRAKRETLQTELIKKKYEDFHNPKE
jgi:hypothetical protein